MLRKLRTGLFLLSILLSSFGLAKPPLVDGSAIAGENQQGGWYSYGRTYDEQRFAPYSQINTTNIDRLKPEWVLDLPQLKSLNSTPLVVGEKLFFSANHSQLLAVDARSGRELWRYDPKVLQQLAVNQRIQTQMAWGANRGIAYWKGSVFVGTSDGRLIAVDADTGRELWSTQTTAIDAPTGITGAPRVFNDKVIIGNAGSEFGAVRGYVSAYDTRTGKQLWRFYIVPGNPKLGFENSAMAMAAKTWTGEWWTHGGGGTVWNAITYDPQFNRVYLGTGNGSPWNQKIRSPGGGDNLFLCAIVALDADTGEYAWHYQTNPGETWDYNSAMDIMLADLKIDGKPRKVIMHAPKNGFFYIIDRSDGKLLSAEKIVKVNWASRIDLASGRPVEEPAARMPEGDALVYPSGYGAHNWHPMSYSPQTGLVYIPIQEMPSFFSHKTVDVSTWRAETFRWSVGFDRLMEDFGPDVGSSALLAWNPLTQKSAWKVALPGIWNGGTLATAGDLVFQGTADGDLVAYDAARGSALWKYPLGIGISAPPISYSVDGKQYVAVLAGWGGAAYFGLSFMSQHGWEYGVHTRRLVTFALDGKAALSAQKPPLMQLAFVDNAQEKLDLDKAEHGKRLFADTCFVCHGYAAVAGGGAPDLRASALAADKQVFHRIVKGGMLQKQGMPGFAQMSESDVQSLYWYIRLRARESLSGKR